MAAPHPRAKAPTAAAPLHRQSVPVVPRAHLAAGDDLRPTRHVTVEPAPDWRRIANAAIIVVAAVNIVFWGAQVLRMVGL